jgi:hypothetical protein
MIQVDTTDYRRFIVRMNQINETFTINAATMMKKVAGDAFVDIVNMTPVKTGNARANWWPSIDDGQRPGQLVAQYRCAQYRGDFV